MTPSHLWRRARARVTAGGEDSGAALIYALLFLTVIAVVVSAVLAFANTSVRTTVALRGQSAQVAGADGAAQVAMDNLRNSTYAGTGTCLSATNSLTLNNFYQPSSGAADSAVVTCAPDPTKTATDPNVAISASNKPGSAILTLGTSAAEDGLNIKVSSGADLKVHGGVFSKSNINVTQGTLNVDVDVAANGNCTGSINSIPTKACNLGSDPRGADPNYAAPNDAQTPRTVPTCTGNKKLVQFDPGLYTDLASLNNMMKNSGCKDSIFWFKPGTYYFNLGGEWLVDTGYLIGGTPTPPAATFNPNSPPAVPGSCWSPIPPSGASPGTWTRPPAGAGVQFVFGGESRIRIKDSKVELCGTYSATKPPIAVYGLKSAVGAVPAQSGSVTAINGDALIKSENSPNSRFYIQGTTYVPLSKLDISLNNSTGQVFRFGVIARSLYLNPTGSAYLGDPVIEIPDDSPSFGRLTIVYLTVYVCPGSATCTTGTGTLRLRAKVGLTDQTGIAVAGQRQVTVFSWSVQR